MVLLSPGLNHALLQLCLLQHLQALIGISTDRSRTVGLWAQTRGCLSLSLSASLCFFQLSHAFSLSYREPICQRGGSTQAQETWRGGFAIEQ